jgi:glucokinase
MGHQVADGCCTLTNVPHWPAVTTHELARALGLASSKVRLVNDFWAVGRAVVSYQVQSHPAQRVLTLHGGQRAPGGSIVVVGLGTGLGVARLVRSPTSGSYLVLPSEGGHAAYAGDTAQERALVSHLQPFTDQHVSRERVVSGPGLAERYRWLRGTRPGAAQPLDAAASYGKQYGVPLAAAITALGGGDGGSTELQDIDPVCSEALVSFCGALGAVARDLALHEVASGGVYIAGGIPPRLTKMLRRNDWPFLTSVRRSTPHDGWMRQVPVHLVIDRQPGLTGAEALALELIDN